ncbi:predicted protein [Naegleria gruberi]|uniref:Predicted protein n=1 Tax=Naegleria gruberi TaxID=5762 RepID=D2UX26_NAEGR|nr:uncharacterized protein NAEGRDRAFT_45272 [Naegleria gruberi]EFC50549.1 predicted protein [Naegleria gruberi]|eukprot:XP_002683293.1 predicted protein [Naegleria gruberi strain NEG-M]
MVMDDDGSTTTDEASSSGAPSLSSINLSSHAQRFHQDHDTLSTTSSMSTFSSGSYSHFVPDINNQSTSNGVATIVQQQPQQPVIKPIINTPTTISLLLRDENFNIHMEKIKEFVKLTNSGKVIKTGESFQTDEEYPYILASNSYTLSIDQDIDQLFIQLKLLYSEKFKDLESNIIDPMTFVNTVLRIGNGIPLVAPRGSQNFTDIDLSDILPPSTIMILKVTAANDGTFKVNLSEDKWKKIEQICRDVILLDEHKEHILQYLSMRMSYVAPNLSLLVGTRIAAQLIGAAGGILLLSQTSADVIQCLGREKKKLEGFSTKTYMGMLPKRKQTSTDSKDGNYLLSYTANDFSHMRYTGFVGLCDLVMEHTPPREKLRKKVARLVATKCALAARIDSCNSAKNGSEGLHLREDIQMAIKKMLEPPKRKEDKPLPAPDSIKKSGSRGGSKSAAEKQLARTSELRKKYARLPFGESGSDDSYTGDGSGTMLGDEGKKGLGRSLSVHNAILASGKRYENKHKKKEKKHTSGSSTGVNTALSSSSAYFDGISTISNTSIFKSGTATQIIRTGTATSMAISNNNEMEILNPNLIAEDQKRKTEQKKGYFSMDTKFKKPSDVMAPPSSTEKKK